MKNPRYTAVELLDKTFEKGSYSNIQLNHALESSDMNRSDKNLCTSLYYGVIERRITLDYIIGTLSTRPVAKLDMIILNILRCGIYQLKFMDSIPDSAAVNESVLLAKQFRKSSASGMVNAVLRNFIRREKSYKLPANKYKSLSVMYSAPEWLIKSLCADYGTEAMENLLADALEKPPVTIRRNTLKCSESEFIDSMGDISVTADEKIHDCFIVSGGSPAGTESFENGFFHVQDRASQLCCMALNPNENDRVLDICAAPGGKTFTMAEMMHGGIIYACDLHEKRVGLINSGAERLGLMNIRTMAGDASVYNAELPKFSKILCDVPCSGVGVIRRKPEIKYKNPSDFEKLPEIQYSILENALKYLEVGGELVYSTCTLRRAENDDVIDKLLKNHPETEPVNFLENMGEPFGGYKASVFPKYFGSDGFFISKIRRVR
jgi:16S rRNA (cytosine967-C5)-methyltransferase